MAFMQIICDGPLCDNTVIYVDRSQNHTPDFVFILSFCHFSMFLSSSLTLKGFVHVEKFSLNVSSSSIVISVHIFHS